MHQRVCTPINRRSNGNKMVSSFSGQSISLGRALYALRVLGMCNGSMRCGHKWWECCWYCGCIPNDRCSIIILFSPPQCTKSEQRHTVVWLVFLRLTSKLLWPELCDMGISVLSWKRLGEAQQTGSWVVKQTFLYKCGRRWEVFLIQSSKIVRFQGYLQSCEENYMSIR